MTYLRTIPRPDPMPTTTEGLQAHLISTGLVRPIAPGPGEACDFCYGARLSHSSTCGHCLNYQGKGLAYDVRPNLAGIVPITYSLDEGFESVLHHYKDLEPESRSYLGCLIGALLWHFLDSHLGCIERVYGAIDVGLTVPSAMTRDGFDPMRDLIEMTPRPWPVDWNFGAIRNVRGGRPGRGAVRPDFYNVDASDRYRGATVLLLDDTWTSGSSLASVAERLMADGVKKVVGLPMGRQLNDGDFGSAQTLRQRARSQRFDPHRCVIHER